MDNGVTKSDAKIWIDAIFGQLSKEVVRNDKVSIRGFGTFYKVKREEKEYRHPKTGENCISPEHINIKFEPRTLIRDSVNH